MNSFDGYREIVQQGLLELQKDIQPPSLKEQINYFLSLGGKRLRPSLLLAGCDLFNGDIDKALKPALGIELFHNFTLMHDDVMDAAPLRRSKETVHQKWDESTAILAGDAMYASAIALVARVNSRILPEIINLFCTTSIEVCEGQQLDMLFEKKENIYMDDYLEMIELKTAVLLACALKMGALIGGADEKDTDQLYQFGKNLGVAFQLQDDILDVYGNKNKFGKQVGGDIKSGKKTFLLIKAIELGDDSIKHLILKKNKTDSDINKIISIYDKLNIKKLATMEMEKCYTNALLNLYNLKNVNKYYLNQLKEFAQGMQVRES
jgi:geranylgeranyl diphosphate synthase, type II